MDNKNHFTVVLPLRDMELAMLQRESNLTDLDRKSTRLNSSH